MRNIKIKKFGQTTEAYKIGVLANVLQQALSKPMSSQEAMALAQKLNDVLGTNAFYADYANK